MLLKGVLFEPVSQEENEGIDFHSRWLTKGHEEVNLGVQGF